MQVGRKLSLNFEIIKITKGNENEFLISILDRGFSSRFKYQSHKYYAGMNSVRRGEGEGKFEFYYT